jgi:septal ring factor EnvC (AmiA/AmiB activator)
LETRVAELTKSCEFHMEAENQLRAQLAVYTQKYDEFQATLSKSNQVFESFKVEMDKMNKKIKRHEQESNQWKTKYEQSNNTLAQQVEKVSNNLILFSRIIYYSTSCYIQYIFSFIRLSKLQVVHRFCQLNHLIITLYSASKNRLDNL